MVPATDQQLVQITDDALTEAARRSGDWLVCKPGCAQCCIGVFAIHQLDAVRLQAGLQDLYQTNPQHAIALRSRAQQSVARLTEGYPGDPVTGVLDDSAEAEARFEDFANSEPCPVLDPQTGTCDLYLARPMTCRIFGPPVRSEQGLGVCELCYHGATEAQIAACEMPVDPDGLEDRILEEVENATGKRGRTVVAFALLQG